MVNFTAKANSIRLSHFIITIFTCLVAAVFATSAATGQVGKTPGVITPEYFGMHVHSAPGYERAFSSTQFGILRTWDSSLGWALIQPEKGAWNWTLLDDYMRLADESGADVLFTLGMTPLWAASNPDAPSPYSGCSSSPPKNMDDYEAFLRALVARNETHYHGRIKYWEIWNEPDNIHAGYEFYTGTMEEMVALARVTHDVLKAANPDYKIVSPGVTQAGRDWLYAFLSGGGAAYVDIIGYHFYYDWYSPRIKDFRVVTEGFKRVMIDAGAGDLPLWTTEIGFAMSHYKTPEQRQAALASVLIATRWYGADFVGTYSWNNGMFTGMYDSKTGEFKETHAAYLRLHEWLLGGVITALDFGKNKTNVATILKNGKRTRILWHAGAGPVKYEIPPAWGDEITFPDGAAAPLPADRVIILNNGPVLISSSK